MACEHGASLGTWCPECAERGGVPLVGSLEIARSSAGTCAECEKNIDSMDPHYSHEDVLLHWPGCFHTRMVRLHTEVTAMYNELKKGS